MDMSKGYYLLMLTLCCLLVEEVEADFEHMCVHEDFSRSGAYSSCGSRLTSLVISKCDGNPYLASRGKFLVPDSTYYSLELKRTQLKMSWCSEQATSAKIKFLMLIFFKVIIRIYRNLY